MDLVAVGDDPQVKWAKCREMALLAESLGIDSIWVYDHFHNVPKPAHETVFECWTTMAALAEATSTIRLGQMVGCALYRSPSLLAKITSNIDVISGGRLEWGVGAGWYDHEFNAYGYDFPAAKDRIRILRETVEIVTTMWRDADADYEGKFFTIKGAQCDPKPVQQPRPPVWIGGGGEQLTLRVVARLADRANFGGNPDEWRHKRDVLFEHCRAVGRDPESIELTWSPEIYIRETDAEARAEFASGAVRSLWTKDYDAWQRGNLIGTPEQVSERLRAYQDMGCSYIVPWCSDYPSDQTVRLLASSVIPNFRSRR